MRDYHRAELSVARGRSFCACTCWLLIAVLFMDAKIEGAARGGQGHLETIEGKTSEVVVEGGGFEGVLPVP